MKSEFITNDILKLIRPRKEDSCKGDFGTLLTLVGSENMTGAACFAAIAALRSGLGLMRFCGNESTLSEIRRILFEPVFVPIADISFEKSTAFLCGCGIGRVYDDILEAVLTSCTLPAVLDADCINFLSMHIDVLERMDCPKILTPHPAEMARLIGKSISYVQSARVETALEFATKYNCVLVLKGKNTVIATSNGDAYINTSGSSALAKGGSGDVLAGVTASLVAQGYGIADAAKIAVYVHGLAGDNLEKTLGKSGVLPSDLPKEIGRILG